MSDTHQFSLLGKRRFLPFFGTQFLGAFNDNVYKNCLMLMVVFAGASALPASVDTMVNLAAGLFILPFFLFSGMAGQLADKYEKSEIIRKIKLVEICIMAVAAYAIISESFTAMLVLLFLMGTQSAFFGPVKYALLPQTLKDEELVGGNALVEMGTFVAILAGTIGAGFLIEFPNANQWIAGSIVVFAILGYFCSRGIPTMPSTAPDLKLDWNPVTQTLRTLRYAKADKATFQSILAISWFWALGAAYLTQLPNFASDVLSGGPQVVTLMLAVFTMGIALGSMICERLSGNIIEIGIVPLGSLGLSIFGIDLFFAINPVTTPLMGAGEFLSHSSNIRVLFDLAMIGFSGGVFIVPLYALIQQRAKPEQRAQIIAANNVLNSLFMVGSAAAGIVMLGVMDLSIPVFFLTLAVVNLAIVAYVYSQVPEFVLRFVIWMLSHTMYRVTHKQLDNIPREGAAVLVCNHVSYVDALLIGGAVKRPVRFVMDRNIYNLPVLNRLFKLSKTIPICPEHKDPETFHKAFEKISEELKEGNLVCIFPEGRLTQDGSLGQFKKGIEKILKSDPVPVVPMALKGLWGSVFSHKGGQALTTRPRRFWSRVEFIAEPPIPAQDSNAHLLEKKVADMLAY
ncbi:MFS transporter [Endozoicomonas numazuensis]|uniref:Acyl-phosphate glycerol 3-phosphate acyltransferase n=1 Tax=Endozoicomonas numazuensis TaxID=1137799 RepID=A0A081NED7_9GAMM|nr:MFS transporter [Endozoicomonas numazuensis]KEQ16810.1 acyl-phosphate glycerol 3-phosphate acyltransferase [Endozoicomonas numazuensis]